MSDDKNTTEGGNSPYALPDMVTADNIDVIKNDLSQYTAITDGEVVVDAKITDIITTPGAQVLLALDNLLKQQKSRLRIINAEELFHQTFEALGLSATLKEWSK